MAIPAWLIPALRFIGANAPKYGPVAWAWLNKNPDVASRIQQEVQRLLRSTGPSPDAMRQSLKAMREQVEYLRRSADDHTERMRADRWAVSLTGLEHALELLSPGSPKADLKRLRERIDALRSEILDAFLAEQIEDAGGPAAIEGRDGAPDER